MVNNVQDAADILKNQLLDLLFKQAPQAFILLIIVAVSMVAVLWDQVAHVTLISWFCIALFITIVRLLLIYAYRKRKTVISITSWQRAFMTLTFVSSSIWGVGTLLFLQQIDATHQMFIIAMLAGITAGAQATFSSSPANCRMFLLPCLLIPSSWLLLQNETILLTIGLLSILYTALLCALNTRHFQRLKRSLVLSIENNALLCELEQEAIEHKHSEIQLLQKNQHMQSLLRLDQALAQAENHRDIIHATANEIERSLGYHIAWLYLPTGEEDWHLLSAHLAEPASVRIHESISQAITSQPIIIDDARTDPHSHQDTLALLDNRNMIIIPMFSANTCLGALATGSCANDSINIPDDSQLSLLSAMAAHVALALDRVNQFNDRLKVQAQFEHAQRLDSLGLMAGGIAHDFNNILTTISGNASLASTKSEDKSITHHLDLILQSSHHAAHLCNQMLAYSGKGHFIIKTVDISDSVHSIASMIDASIGKHINIHYNLSQGLSAIRVDTTQLQQVIMNLLINASEAIGDESGEITVTTGEMHADTAMLTACYGDSPSAGDYVYLEVRDNGCGMDEKTRHQLFDPFFTTKFTGRGLGMSAMLGIVRGHKGAILLDTMPGQGTTFRILLPASSEAPEQQQTQQPTLEPSDNIENGIGIKPANSGTILLIDDEPMVIDVAHQVLKRADYDVLTAIGGEAALQLYRQHHQSIALILLDLTMPGMNGKACFDQLININAQAKVMIVSGYSEEDAMTQFDGFQMAGFIRKPYKLENFLSDVNQALSGSISNSIN